MRLIASADLNIMQDLPRGKRLIVGITGDQYCTVWQIVCMIQGGRIRKCGGGWSVSPNPHHHHFHPHQWDTWGWGQDSLKQVRVKRILKILMQLNVPWWHTLLFFYGMQDRPLISKLYMWDIFILLVICTEEWNNLIVQTLLDETMAWSLLV